SRRARCACSCTAPARAFARSSTETLQPKENTMSENQQPNHDPLEEAISAFQRMTVPNGPSDAAVLDQLGTRWRDTAPLHAIPSPWRRRYLMRLLIPSAAAALLALLVGGLLLMNGTAPLAFAEVVENVKNAESVTYAVKSKFESLAALEQQT